MTDNLAASLAAVETETAVLTDLVQSAPEAFWDTVYDGDGNARRVLVHLVDDELVFGYRLRTAIATPGQTVPLFDPEPWAKHVPSADMPARVIAAAFTGLRVQHAAILRALPADVWQYTIVHPEYGPQSVETLAGIFLPHSAEHLAQLGTMLAGA